MIKVRDRTVTVGPRSRRIIQPSRRRFSITVAVHGHAAQIALSKDRLGAHIAQPGTSLTWGEDHARGLVVYGRQAYRGERPTTLQIREYLS